MKKPFIYSAIAFVLFLFGCEEEYDLFCRYCDDE